MSDLERFSLSLGIFKSRQYLTPLAEEQLDAIVGLTDSIYRSEDAYHREQVGFNLKVGITAAALEHKIDLDTELVNPGNNVRAMLIHATSRDLYLRDYEKSTTFTEQHLRRQVRQNQAALTALSTFNSNLQAIVKPVTDGIRGRDIFGSSQSNLPIARLAQYAKNPLHPEAVAIISRYIQVADTKTDLKEQAIYKIALDSLLSPTLENFNDSHVSPKDQVHADTFDTLKKAGRVVKAYMEAYFKEWIDFTQGRKLPQAISIDYARLSPLTNKTIAEWLCVYRNSYPTLAPRVFQQFAEDTIKPFGEDDFTSAMENYTTAYRKVVTLPSEYSQTENLGKAAIVAQDIIQAAQPESDTAAKRIITSLEKVTSSLLSSGKKIDVEIPGIGHVLVSVSRENLLDILVIDAHGNGLLMQVDSDGRVMAGLSSKNTYHQEKRVPDTIFRILAPYLTSSLEQVGLPKLPTKAEVPASSAQPVRREKRPEAPQRELQYPVTYQRGLDKSDAALAHFVTYLQALSPEQIIEMGKREFVDTTLGVRARIKVFSKNGAIQNILITFVSKI